MPKEFITSGYLDVKISTKVKRGFTPWRAWKKQWCELTRIDNINNGVEIKLKNTQDSNSSNSFVIPRNATLCRTESRSKQYCFGIFGADRSYKPLLFLSGNSESDSQLWMFSIRRMLLLNSHLPNSDGFYISVIDNDHSRIAGLTGLHGILKTNTHEVIIKDASTDDIKTSFSWFHLHQFHLAATNLPEDDKKIVVIHTSKHFHSGPGQIYFFCLKAPGLLDCLVSRGKIPRIRFHSFRNSRRLSRSEGDLRESENCLSIPTNSPTSPNYYFRSHCGSDDSGVRVSMTSDDSNLILKCKKAVSYISLGFGLLVATPGGSEIDNESSNGLLLENEEEQISTECLTNLRRNMEDLRRESGVSIMSGVYEEIPDIPPPKEFQNQNCKFFHTYEDPVDVMLGSSKSFSPPPLPPRQIRQGSSSDEDLDSGLSPLNTPLKLSPEPTCETMLTILTQSESEYMEMTSGKAFLENVYMPMNSGNQKLSINTEEENAYMIMSGKRPA